MDVEAKIFYVADEPYCLWDQDYKDRNMRFLDGIDTKFYQFICESMTKEEDEKRISVLLRSYLHHGMETMFSLMGALLQAPEYVYAWVPKCNNYQSRQIVKWVLNEGVEFQSVFGRLQENVSYLEIANIVFKSSKYSSDKDKNTVQLFADFWTKASSDYISTTFINEYNSIKHGFRIKPGGFGIKVGVEESKDIKAPKEKMQSLGHSEFGMKIYEIINTHNCRKCRSIVSKETSVNWSLEGTLRYLEAISMSINNIVSALKILNGKPSNECIYIRPIDFDTFNAPWAHSIGVLSMTIEPNFSEEQISQIKYFTKEQLNEYVKKQRSKIIPEENTD